MAHPDAQVTTYRGGRGERGAARGARGASLAAKEAVHAYGRGKQLTQENFQFKVKEKDNKNESMKRSDDRSADSCDKHYNSNDNTAEIGRDEPKPGEYIYVKKRATEAVSTAANVEVLDQHALEEELVEDKESAFSEQDEQPESEEEQEQLQQACLDVEGQEHHMAGRDEDRQRQAARGTTREPQELDESNEQAS